MSSTELARLVASDTETATDGVRHTTPLEDTAATIARMANAIGLVFAQLEDIKFPIVRMYRVGRHWTTLRPADVLPYPLAMHPDNVREMG